MKSTWHHLGAGWPLIALLVASACGDNLSASSAPDKPAPELSYTNPLKIQIPGTDKLVENCPDPSIIQGQTPGDTDWYLYCTSNPLYAGDKDASGKDNFHLIAIHRSSDLVHWTYVGDAFTEQPPWAAAPQGFWAPDIQYFNDQYYLYYASSETIPGEPGDNVIGAAAIGVATSKSPTGPWTHAPTWVVEPMKAPCCLDREDYRWVIDSNVTVDDQGQRYIYFGSYYGGVAVRKLSADGLTSDPVSQQEIVSDERYEGEYIVKRDGYYYLFVSATNCCAGPLTGYSVFVGRSQSPTGPFVDKEGVPFTPGRVGGTPVISMNGNKWVGTGHNAVFTDHAGQDWILYHAINRNDPYRNGSPLGDFPVKRAALIDPLDWVNGWPTVRGGYWASDTAMPAPAAQAGDPGRYQMKLKPLDEPGAMIASLSDEFSGTALGAQWSWVREPTAGTFAVENGVFRFDVQPKDIYVDINNAAVLTEAAPSGDYLVETAVSLEGLPAMGCCFNYTQAGLVIYGDDDRFIKLVPFSLWDTRQIEFAKEEAQADIPPDYPRYGNTVAGPPGETTYLRIAVHRAIGIETYTAYTSLDGQIWNRNGTWTHHLGQTQKIGLVSMARPSDPADTTSYKGLFQYVRVYELTKRP